jgi:2-polyprenyl-6-methoxyphenol hydroxylase-like FAD-dependent oxidoreductase
MEEWAALTDAAHVHSPVGARGMNLGLEDAWIFSELVRAQRLPEVEPLCTLSVRLADCHSG